MSINTTKEKKATLSNEALIYEKREQSGAITREKFKQMTREQKWIHFKTYYTIPLLVAIFAIGVLSFLVYDFSSRKTEVYHCAVVNEIALPEKVAAFSTGFLKAIQKDPKRNSASFDMLYTDAELAAIVGNTAPTDMIRISSLIAATALDSMIADETTFNSYYKNSKSICFGSVATVLKNKCKITDEQYKKLTPYLYTPKGAKEPYGIRIPATSKYYTLVEKNKTTDQPILGFIANGIHLDQSLALVRYLLPDLLNN